MTWRDDDGYRSAFAAWPTPGLLVDDQLVVRDANDSFVRVLGRSRESLVGRRVLDLFPDTAGGGPAGPLGRSVRTALRTGRPDRLPLLDHPVDVDGEVVQRWWSVLTIPLLDPSGAVVGALNAVEDLTEMMAEQDRSRLVAAAAEDLRRQSEKLTDDLRRRHLDVDQVRTLEARTARRCPRPGRGRPRAAHDRLAGPGGPPGVLGGPDDRGAAGHRGGPHWGTGAAG